MFVRAGVLTERTPAAPNPTVLQKTHTQPSPWRGLRIIWRDTMPNYVCSRRCPHRAHHASSTQSYCLAKDPHPTLSLERAKNYLVRCYAELCLFALASSPSALHLSSGVPPCARTGMDNSVFFSRHLTLTHYKRPTLRHLTSHKITHTQPSPSIR